jgi:hypothetical protein
VVLGPHGGVQLVQSVQSVLILVARYTDSDSAAYLYGEFAGRP